MLKEDKNEEKEEEKNVNEEEIISKSISMDNSLNAEKKNWNARLGRYSYGRKL